MTSVATSRATQVLMNAAADPEVSASCSTSPSKALSVRLMAAVTAAAESRSVTSMATRTASQPCSASGSLLCSTAW